MIRRKREALEALPSGLGLQYCLDAAGIEANDLAAVVGTTVAGTEPGRDYRPVHDRHQWLPDSWRGFDFVIPHHLAHAWSAFGTSGTTTSAVLVVDGSGNTAEYLARAHAAEIQHAPLASWPEFAVATPACEIASIYVASGATLVPIEKHIGTFEGPLADATHGRGMLAFGSLGDMFTAVSDLVFAS